MARKYIDCREYPSDKKCSIAMSGEEEDVVRAATQHAVSEHGYQDTPEFREELKTMLKDEPADSRSGKEQAA